MDPIVSPGKVSSHAHAGMFCLLYWKVIFEINGMQFLEEAISDSILVQRACVKASAHLFPFPRISPLIGSQYVPFVIVASETKSVGFVQQLYFQWEFFGNRSIYTFQMTLIGGITEASPVSQAELSCKIPALWITARLLIECFPCL